MLILAERQKQLRELKLHFGIIRPQLRGFLEQSRRLRELTLVIIDDAQLPDRDRVSLISREDSTILLLGLIELRGGQRRVGARQQFFLRGLASRTSRGRERNQTQREDGRVALPAA